jgi:hypothetical protein
MRVPFKDNRSSSKTSDERERYDTVRSRSSGLAALLYRHALIVPSSALVGSGQLVQQVLSGEELMRPEGPLALL